MDTIIYCYDAYCGWCYGFSPIMKRIAEEFENDFHFEVLSGGMILPETPKHISIMSDYINQTVPLIEQQTGIKFGEDYLWHINNPDKSDWYPHSLKPAIALCVFKEYHPDKQVQFAFDLQYALNFEGRDLTDDEAYRHLLSKYNINEEEFYRKLNDQAYSQAAHDEFAVSKHLKVTGYPTVFQREDEKKFRLLARGFTDYTILQPRFKTIRNKTP